MSQGFDIKSKPIDLPSEGYFYPEDHPLADGVIEIRHMTAADEDILTDRQLLKKGEAVDRLIDAVIVEEGVELGDVLNGDVGGIMLATRILAYGPQYPFEIECPVCEEKNQKVADLNEIEGKDVDFDSVEPHQTRFFTRLPVTDVEIGFKLLTRGDVQQVNKELKRSKRQSGRKTEKGLRPSGQVTTNMTTRLRRIIQEVNGETSKAEIRKFVEQMPARDSLYLRKEVEKLKPDIDLEYEFVCDHCGAFELVDIPLDETFFFPTQ